MYRNVFEYDRPMTHPEPKTYKLVSAEDSDSENPWKESFRLLVRIHSSLIFCYLRALKLQNLLYTLYLQAVFVNLYSFYALTQCLLFNAVPRSACTTRLSGRSREEPSPIHRTNDKSMYDRLFTSFPTKISQLPIYASVIILNGQLKSADFFCMITFPVL